MRECGTPDRQVGADSATMKKRTCGCRGGCGARPCGHRRVFLERLVVAEGRGAGAARGDQRRRAGRRRQGGQETGPGPARGARHGDAHRQRRDQDARRQRDRRGAIRGRRPGQAGRLCSPSTAARSKPRSSGSRRSSPAPRRSSSRPSATCAATPSWSPRTPPPRSRSTTPRPRSTSPAALADSNKATLENLKVQLGYCTIRAPISGRISMASVKVGNFVRPGRPGAARHHQPGRADLRHLHACRSAVCRMCARRSRRRPRRSRRSFPAATRRAAGQVTMIENTVDPATGMVTVRATMPNEDELLWPGTLVNRALTLRNEERGHRSGGGGAGQPGRLVRVRGEGQRRHRPPGQGRADRRRR